MSETKEEIRSETQTAYNDIMNEVYRKTYSDLISADPELDPSSPQFNREKYEAATEKQIFEIQENFKLVQVTLIEYMKTQVTKAASIEFPEKQTAILKDLAKHIETCFGGDSSDGEKTNSLLQIINKYWEYVKLRAALHEELKKKEYEGKQINELSPELQTQALTNAQKALSAVADKKESAEDLPILTVTGKGAEKLEHPLDKLNSKVWALFEEADSSGQITMAFSAEKKGSKKQADILYSVNFDDLEESGLNVVKRITAFDKRVQLAANALYQNTGELMTVSQIYATMGNDTRPNKTQIDKIYTSLEKMRLIPIRVDNTSEHKLYPNIEKFVYNGVMLPWESVDAIVNGQRAEGVIHLFREPPLVSFAKSRKQITTIPRALLASPISKTEVHLLIDDYLITRISRLKKSNGKVSNKLLFETIFSKVGINTRLQKSRAKEAIIKYLDHYKECDFIKGYKTTTDGVSIQY